MNSRFARMGRVVLFLAPIAMVAATLPAPAATPSNLSDLVSQDADRGSNELRRRGYTRVSSDRHDGSRYEYWWNAASETCVQTRADDGRYQALKTTTRTDCGQYHQGSGDTDNAAAIAIGAAAILGAAALAHNSHQRNDQHGQDSKSVSEFDRGYRDGLYNHPYHNYGNARAYSDGYSTGLQERNDQTSYRPSHGGSGYQPYVAVNDLVDARASSADSELRNRGFQDVGGYKEGEKSHVTWYNRNTRQCLDVVTRDGRIRHLNSIAEGNCQ
jgi:hypothetical protein